MPRCDSATFGRRRCRRRSRRRRLAGVSGKLSAVIARRGGGVIIIVVGTFSSSSRDLVSCSFSHTRNLVREIVAPLGENVGGACSCWKRIGGDSWLVGTRMTVSGSSRSGSKGSRFTDRRPFPAKCSPVYPHPYSSSSGISARENSLPLSCCGRSF